MSSTYYGWRIVALASVALMLTGPGQTIGMSVFVDEIVVDLDVSRSQVSLAYLIATLTSAATLSFVGRGIDRFGVRTAMTVIGIAFGFAIAGFAGVVGFGSMVVAFTLLRMLGQGALSLTATTAVAQWFDRRRGFAVGTTTAVGAGLMSLVPVIFTAVIGLYGWRAGLLVIAPVVSLLVILIARFGIRNRPRDVGLAMEGGSLQDQEPEPDETEEAANDSGADREPRSPEDHGVTGGEAMRTMMFWGLALVFASPSMISTGLMFHQLAVLGEQGLTATQAAVAFVPFSLAAMAVTFAGGALVDRWSPKVMLTIPTVMLIAAMNLVPHVTPGAMVLLYAVLLGGSSGSARSMEPTLMARFYGLAHVGAVRGRMMSFRVAASALGPYALALGFEQFGAFGPALRFLTVLPVAALILLAFSPDPRHKRRSVQHNG